MKRRKRALLARLRIPPDALPGSLVLSHRRCGKTGCHCAEGPAHPFYSLTFMVDGKKHVESIPAEWIDAVRPAVEAGRSFKDLGVTGEQLSKCKAPILFIHGGSESAYVKDHVAYVRNLLGRGELKIVEGGDHVGTLAKPEFASAIRTFLRAAQTKGEQKP